MLDGCGQLPRSRHTRAARSWRLSTVWMLTAALGINCAVAEPVSDRILSGQQVVTKNGCLLVKISFNIRIRYMSHFPLDRGEELRIGIRPIDPAQAAAELLTRRESLRPPDLRVAPIKAIEFEAARAGGPTLTLRFQRPVSYQVGPGADFESIVVAIADPQLGKACKPEFPIGASGTWTTSVQRDEGSRSHDQAKSEGTETARSAASRNRERPAGKISDADLKKAAAAMDEGRAALKKQDYAQAIRLFTKVLSYPENVHSAEAQELLGIVYQKSNQPAAAQAEYDDYLRRYPTGEGADSVRQRRDAILTANMPREEKLRAARSSTGDGELGSTQSTWVVSGSASQFYVRDDSFRIVRDPSLPPILNADKEDHRVHRNALLSSFDLTGVWSNDQVKSKFRFSGTEEHRFGSDDKEIVGVAALSLEAAVKEWGTMARVGRQTRSTGGVLGRFDGGLLSWQGTPWLRVNVVGGSPVASRRDEPFKDEKVFYGTSVDFGPFYGGFDFSLFAIQQQVGNIIDRQAIGTELRYLDAFKSAFLTIDYDTHFQEINAAIFSGSWTFADKSNLHGGADYRKSPYLTSWNALQGLQILTLYDLLKLRTKSEIEQMAIDRTAAYSSVNIGYSRYLTDKLQLNLDATAAHIDGTIASFGVDAMPSTGNEFYYSAQLIGSNLFWDGDLFTAGLRLADRQDSRTYVADFGTRFPLTQDWRINPRLLLSYREGKTTNLAEYAVLPSILVNYYLSKDLSFEIEVGAKKTWREQAGIKDEDTDFFFTIGYRYDFYADGKGLCGPSMSKC